MPHSASAAAAAAEAAAVAAVAAAAVAAVAVTEHHRGSTAAGLSGFGLSRLSVCPSVLAVISPDVPLRRAFTVLLVLILEQFLLLRQIPVLRLLPFLVIAVIMLLLLLLLRLLPLLPLLLQRIMLLTASTAPSYNVYAPTLQLRLHLLLYRSGSGWQLLRPLLIASPC